MKLSAKTLCLSAALLMALSAQAFADIRIGVASEPYPPFTYKDTAGKWVGWEIDLIDALCAQMKEKCVLTETAWDGIIPSLNIKKIDVILASMSKTDERKKVISFSDTYYNAAPMMLGEKNGDKNITPEHLAGKTIGVQAATIHADYLAKYFAKTAKIKTYQTEDEVTQDLAAGRVDYVLANGLALDSFLKGAQGSCCESKDPVPPDDVIFGEGAGLGFRKEDVDLQKKFNAALGALAARGELEKITKKFDLTGELITPTK
jgi:polar amino acid transport system substrate-binding protein